MGQDEDSGGPQVGRKVGHARCTAAPAARDRATVVEPSRSEGLRGVCGATRRGSPLCLLRQLAALNFYESPSENKARGTSTPHSHESWLWDSTQRQAEGGLPGATSPASSRGTVAQLQARAGFPPSLWPCAACVLSIRRGRGGLVFFFSFSLPPLF